MKFFFVLVLVIEREQKNGLHQIGIAAGITQAALLPFPVFGPARDDASQIIDMSIGENIRAYGQGFLVESGALGAEGIGKGV